MGCRSKITTAIPWRSFVCKTSLQSVIHTYYYNMISSYSSPFTVSTKSTAAIKVTISTIVSTITMNTCGIISSTTTTWAPTSSLSWSPLCGIIHSDCSACQILHGNPVFNWILRPINTTQSNYTISMYDEKTWHAYWKDCCTLVLWHPQFPDYG